MSGGLVAAVGVEGEVSDELAGGGVEDADVEVVDEADDAGSVVVSAEADGVEGAVVAQGDLAGLVDDVVAHAQVGVALPGRCGFGSSGVCPRRG